MTIIKSIIYNSSEIYFQGISLSNIKAAFSTIYKWDFFVELIKKKKEKKRDKIMLLT